MTLRLKQIKGYICIYNIAACACRSQITGFSRTKRNTSVRRVPGFSFFGFVLRRGEVGVGFQEAFPVAVEQIQRPEARVAEQAVLGGKAS